MLNKFCPGGEECTGNSQDILKLQICPESGGISDKLCPGGGAGAKWFVLRVKGTLKKTWLPPPPG